MWNGITLNTILTRISAAQREVRIRERKRGMAAAGPENVPPFIAAQLSHLLSHFGLTVKAIINQINSLSFHFHPHSYSPNTNTFFSFSGWTNVVEWQIQLHPPRSLHPPHPLLLRLHQMYAFFYQSFLSANVCFLSRENQTYNLFPLPFSLDHLTHLISFFFQLGTKPWRRQGFLCFRGCYIRRGISEHRPRRYL